MLSPIIEYLFAQNRLTGERLCHPDRLGYYMEIPPLMTVYFTLVPSHNSYAAIKYASTISDDAVPGAFLFYTYQGGDPYGPGVDYPDWTREFLPYFVLFSTGMPIQVKMVNLTNMNQQVSGGQWNLIISTEENYREVIKRLDQYCGVADRANQQEAIKLLQQLIDFQRRGGR
jgi:hypothetical protein